MLLDAGVAAVEVPFGGPFDWITRTKIKNEIKGFKPNLVLSWMNRATRFCSNIKNPKIVHVARLGGYYDLKYYKHCDRLICNTEGIRNYLKAEGWSPEKVTYLPNFVGVGSSPPLDRQRYFTPENAPLILAMGRFHQNKGFDVLLRALTSVPGAYLWLAGEGPLKEQLSQMSEKLGVKPRVRFVGWHKDISALLRTADIFVCPSRHEPLGNVIIEAWAHEIPVVATDSDGPGALINHLISGVLVPVDNELLMAKAIRNLLGDERLKEKVIVNGQKQFAEFFTEEIVTKSYIEFFEKVLIECAGSQA
jgi:glycosyltransferase involved in cell wall biosynthesis